MGFSAQLDLWTILEGTGEDSHYNTLVNERIRAVGGVRRGDELEEFVFAILEDMETRIQKKVKERSMTARGLKEIVYETIEEMRGETEGDGK